MEGFSSSSSSPYESEIDQILAEAMDHCVLEQVAAINCSSFTHTVLPSHIENRFQKLKTFPSHSSKPQLGPDSAPESKVSGGGGEGKMGNSNLGRSKDVNFEGKMDNSPSMLSKDSCFEDHLGGREGKMGNLPSKLSTDSGFEDDLGVREGKMGNSVHGQSKVSNFEGLSGVMKGKKGNAQGGYVSSSPSDSSSEYMDSPKVKKGKQGVKGKMGISDSEEETAGKSGVVCLCFSPKRASGKKEKEKKKKSKGSGGGGGGELGFSWGKDEELLSDLRSFSSKEQKKRMKEALKDEEEINKEAEKIVKWAKQVSARMDFDISDDDLDDYDYNDHRKHHFGRP